MRPVILIVLAIATLALAEADEPLANRVPGQITLREVADLKTAAEAQKFAVSHGLAFSKQTTDQMRRQKEQIPASAVGAVGRVWITVFLDESDATAHVYLYHDESERVISTIVHIEPVNKP